jgi:membrane protein DedA with SNARE-associated domain
MKTKTILQIIAIPLTILVISLTYMVLWRVLDLPRGEEFIALVTEFFAKYGLWVVFLCSVLESALLLGNYFPGGVVIFMGVVAAGGNPVKVIATVAVVSLGFFIGYGIDYLLGKYGWYKAFVKLGMRQGLERAQDKLTKHSLKAFLGSYWEPNLASITATGAGVLQLPVKRFLIESTLAIIIWNTFWGTLVASVGKNILILFTKWEYLLIGVVVWGLIVLIRELIARRKEKPAIE